MAFSTILTKVNTVQVQFKDQILLKQQMVSENLEKFVNFLHPRLADVINLQEFISVANSKNHYRYYNYGTHFMRLNVFTGSKKWFKVS